MMAIAIGPQKMLLVSAVMASAVAAAVSGGPRPAHGGFHHRVPRVAALLHLGADLVD